MARSVRAPVLRPPVGLLILFASDAEREQSSLKPAGRLWSWRDADHCVQHLLRHFGVVERLTEQGVCRLLCPAAQPS